MTTTQAPGRHTLKLIVARSIHERLVARVAAFEADRDEWYRSGDGRRPNWQYVDGEGFVNLGGKGHTYPAACVHGASAWTDYDNICGPCENGYSLLEIALGEAGQACAEFYRRSGAADHLRMEDSLADDLRKSLTDWVFEPLDDLLARPHRARPLGRLP